MKDFSASRMFPFLCHVHIFACGFPYKLSIDIAFAGTFLSALLTEYISHCQKGTGVGVMVFLRLGWQDGCSVGVSCPVSDERGT